MTNGGRDKGILEGGGFAILAQSANVRKSRADEMDVAWLKLSAILVGESGTKNM